LPRGRKPLASLARMRRRIVSSSIRQGPPGARGPAAAGVRIFGGAPASRVQRCFVRSNSHAAKQRT
jgi:hypothetical protein